MMARGPAKASMIGRAMAMARRNPLATTAALIGIFAGIPGAVAGVGYLNAAAEEWRPAFLSDVIVMIDGKRVPVIVVAQDHSAAIDFLIIKEQYRALEVAKEDLKRDPNSVSAKKEVETLNKSIDVRQKRIDKATGGR